MANDKADIIELMNLYGLAMDSRRRDLFDRIFTEHCDATRHVMTNHLVTVDGNRAHSLTYGMWRLIRHAAAGSHPSGPLCDGTGWYDDEWVRTNGGWRIARAQEASFARHAI